MEQSEQIRMQVLTETQVTKASCDNLSCNKGGNDLSPEPSGTIPSPTQPKPNTGRFAQRHKKPVDNGPKIKKLKYHQYVPPDQRGSRETPLWVDSSSSSILQQQQLFLQLLIFSQQQQSYSCHPDLAGPSRPQKDPLDEMKVADLRSELKLRSLPVYGTKIDLIKRLRASEEAGGGGDASSPPAGGTIGPGAEGAFQWHQTIDARSRSSPFTNASWPQMSAASSVTGNHSSTAPLTADRDEMLREKDEQIEELTRMLRQEQKLVEALKMQLEGGGQVPDPLVLVRGKPEPPDEPSIVPPLLRLSPPATSRQMALKQEAAEEVVSETLELPQFMTQKVQEQIVPQIRLEPSNPKKARQYICLQRSTTEERLLRQRGNAQSRRQNQPECHEAQQILPKPLKQKPVTKNTKQIKLLINLKQQQVQIQNCPQVPSPQPVPPSCHLQSDQRRVDATEEEQRSSRVSGRLEDFLESATGRPLLGAEPGGHLALIDDLHTTMLCTPSVLDCPPSPMDSFNASAEVLINDWLDLNMGGETDEETQVPLGPQTPCGIFSTDCLDSCMMV